MASESSDPRNPDDGSTEANLPATNSASNASGKTVEKKTVTRAGANRAAGRKPGSGPAEPSGLDRLPMLLKVHSNKILLAVALALLVVAALRYRRNQAAAERYGVEQSLAVAWDAVGRLESLGLESRLPDDMVATTRKQYFDNANEAVETVINASDTNAPRTASAWLARGRLYWTMAHLPPLPGATTRPTLNPPRSTTEYLTSSQEAYDKVLANFADQAPAAIQSQFALAAIAEERGQWDKAEETYKKINAIDAALPADKRLAAARIERLVDLKKPVLLGTPKVAGPLTELLQNATEQPLTLDRPLNFPSSQPASNPTTQAPASQPAALATQSASTAATQPTP